MHCGIVTTPPLNAILARAQALLWVRDCAEAVQGLKGKVKLSISLHFTVLRMFSNSCLIQEQ